MSNSSSSHNSQFERESEAMISPITTRTSMASPDQLNLDTSEDPRRTRRNSNVHWKEDRPLLADEKQNPPVSASRDVNHTGFGAEDWAKSPSQPYMELLEEHSRLRERMNMLESRLPNVDLLRSSDYSEKGDGSSERSCLSTEPQWMTWQEYLEPTGRATNILEVLIEKPHTNSRRKSLGTVPETAIKLQAKTPPMEIPVKNIERIRIRSLHIINALQQITEQTFPNSSCYTIHRPFKILLFHKEQIEEYLADLVFHTSQNADCIFGDKCKAAPSLCKERYGSLDSYYQGDSGKSGNSQSPCHASPTDTYHDNVHGEDQAQNSNTIQGQQLSGSDGEECQHEVSEDLLAQREAITHLRALSNFMDEDMREIFKRHHLLRSSEPGMVYFSDIWHLFMAGDLVVTNDETKPMVYRVSILPARQFFPSRRPVKSMKFKSDGSHQQVESIYAQESMTVANIDVFSYDFDGQTFGPVETRITVVSFDGLKKVTDLPIYPLRFREDAALFETRMLGRGRKYRELLTIPHWEYNGLSVVEPQEQIDSQVIIDVPLAYRKYPATAPKFGLKSWIEDDARIVTEACGVAGCTECFKDRFMFDDHRIDRQRTVEFMKSNEALLRIINDAEDLTDELLLLLPRWVYGFVLRSRRWYYLNIDRVHEVHRQSEGFESLILPQGVARLVEGLVQTHGPRDKPILAPEKLSSEHQFDLVRGKGKGLIILLHGAPGVGKTSTAECVADYTHRPLFPITCGDIGETAKEVEQNLEQNFSLAHRWGCVLLLDEADVFLQARDKEDMRRNSVVSVFLRVLEYYSGILFLTTNKVGHFDEAFKSRIHVSLYYPPLDERSTMQIWKMNLRRLADSKKHLEVNHKAIKKYAKKHFAELTQAKSATWNGRQIKNAFQTAIALAEFDARTDHQEKPTLTKEHFRTVAKASKGFDAYLARIHGPDADRARREGQRDDDRYKPVLFPTNDSSDTSSSDDSDHNRKKSQMERSTKARDKSKIKSKAKSKARDPSSDQSSQSSSEDSDAKEKKRFKKDISSKTKENKRRSKSKARGKAQDSDSDKTSTE